MNNSVKRLVYASLLLSMAIVFQLLGRNFASLSQYVTGPGVNAVLFLSTFLCGIPYGIAVGALTPSLALLFGILPSPLAPFIPFIMISNILLVIVFGVLKDKKIYGKYLGVVISSFVKFGFTYLAASKLVEVLSLKVPLKILISMMSLPILITALIGGFIAIIVIELLNKTKSKQN